MFHKPFGRRRKIDSAVKKKFATPFLHCFVKNRFRNQKGVGPLENSEEGFFGLATGKRQC